MPISDYFYTEKETIYLEKLKRELQETIQDMENAGKKPSDIENTEFGCSCIILSIMLVTFFTPVAFSVSDGNILIFLISMIVIIAVVSITVPPYIKLVNKKESERKRTTWTPELGRKRAYQIAIDRNLKEKEYLLSAFGNIGKLDSKLKNATEPNHIIAIADRFKIIKRKILLIYKDILSDEKLKSLDRYSRSIFWNQVLDGNYSTLDHLRATKIIQTEERERLEGFLIALSHIERSLIWADELLMEY